MKARTIITVDRSLLAANMYRLILVPLGFSVFTARSLEEMTEGAKRMRGADLLVVSSNALSGRVARFARVLEGDARLMRAEKIFLVSERDRAKGMGAELTNIPGGEVMMKPFHPAEFTTAVIRLLGGEE